MRSRPRFHSVRSKIIFWIFVPTAMVLAVVAVATFVAFQQVTKSLAVERDGHYADLSAAKLSIRLTQQYRNLLSEYSGALARLMAGPAGTGPSDAVQRTLLVARGRLEPFDAGVLVLDNSGAVIAATPEHAEALGESWADRSYFRQMLRTPAPILTDIVPDGPGGTEVIVFAEPIIGDQGQFLGLVAGMLGVGQHSMSALYQDFAELEGNGHQHLYLVDGRGRVIYHRDPSQVLVDLSQQAVVQRVLDGQVGATLLRSPGGQTVLAGYAPVPGTNWGLLTETDWDVLLSATRSYSNLFFAVLAVGTILPGVVVAVVVAVLSLNFLGDGLRDAADPYAR